MVNSRQMRRLATRPHEMVRFLHTGKLPQGVRPKSPLVELLRELRSGDLEAIRGLTVDARLGYGGQRSFGTAAQALHWVYPAPEVFDSYPAGSWQDKRFVRRLTLDDLLACATSAPTGLADRYPRLR